MKLWPKAMRGPQLPRASAMSPCLVRCGDYNPIESSTDLKSLWPSSVKRYAHLVDLWLALTQAAMSVARCGLLVSLPSRVIGFNWLEIQQKGALLGTLLERKVCAQSQTDVVWCLCRRGHLPQWRQHGRRRARGRCLCHSCGCAMWRRRRSTMALLPPALRAMPDP